MLNSGLDYFTKVLEDDLKAVIKPQYVDQIPKAVKGSDRTVEKLVKGRSQMDNYDDIIDSMGLFIDFFTYKFPLTKLQSCEMCWIATLITFPEESSNDSLSH